MKLDYENIRGNNFTSFLSNKEEERTQSISALAERQKYQNPVPKSSPSRKHKILTVTIWYLLSG